MDFSSENFDRTHPKILRALIRSNKGFATSYGKDGYTKTATETFKEVFGEREIEVYYCFNGTGANNFAISSITEKHNSVFCSEVSHIYTAESTAPETFIGCRLYPVKSINGKIVQEELLLKLKKENDVHLPKPAVLTITQPTEFGTVYSAVELRDIAKVCKERSILLHIDGARIWNALAAMNCTFKDFITITGVDVLTLGGTKAGLMFGEAVIFFNSKRFKNLHYNHKRSMQLASKNRFIAIQFYALFQNELWKALAKRTNNLAQYFEQEITRIDKSVIVYPVETNVVFIKMKRAIFQKLKPTVSFYMWDVENDEARCVFSFSNTKKEIDLFINKYKKLQP